jgi:hypothetical protein
VPFAELPLDLLHDWIEESYCLVAPKRLAAVLTEGVREESADVRGAGGDDA